MANEITYLSFGTGETMYAVIRAIPALTRWNTAGATLEAFATANWTDYDIALSESPSGGYEYRGNWPASLTTTGYYEVLVYRRDGANPAITDTLVEVQRGYWDATEYARYAADMASISKDGTAADNLEKACDGTTYNIGGGAVVAASVTGATGSVTGAVGSVTGNVGGNVTGSVGSVASYGTLVADIWAALTSGMSTVGSIGKKLADWVIGTLADDAITSAKFDETTAFPLKSADTGSTAVARTGADGDTLETLSDQIDTVSPDAGSGARTVVVTVTDGTNPLESAHVRMTKGVTVLALSTNSSGVATFYCDDGTWTLAVSLAGYTYTATSQVVDGTEAITAAMTAVAIPAASDPTQSNAYLYTYDAHGNIEGSVTVTFELVEPPSGSARAHTRTAFTATSHASTGLLTTALMRSGNYRARRGAAGWTTFIVSDASTYAIPKVVGVSA